MIRKIIFSLVGLILGVGVTYGVLFYFFQSDVSGSILSGLPLPRKQIIGFLPYWQLTTAKQNYKGYITTLAYFGLALDSDGTILKLKTPQEREPGWNALISGKATPYLTNAKKNHEKLSLVIFSGNIDTINSAINNPTQSGKNVVNSVLPLIKQYGFSDLNIDIEYTAHASPEARVHFTNFIQAIRHNLPATQTITVEIFTTDALKPNLIDIEKVGNIADHIVIMAYDYHSPDSYVTGPVAPLSGAGTISEYDVTTAVSETVKHIPSEKVMLGMPLYGYEWESLTPDARGAVIPHSGVIASSHRAESLIASCSTCSATFDSVAKEMHINYLATDTNTYHQIYIPTKESTQNKLDLANFLHLGGVALWALGYEGKTILTPLQNYW